MITDYGVKGLIGAGLRAKPTPLAGMIDALAKNVPSNVPAGQSERLDFLGSIPAFRKWIGSRSVKKVIQQFHSAVLEKYEATVDVPLDLVRNDKTGQVQEIAGGLPARKRGWKNKLLIDMLNNGAGTTLVAFDGLAFFSDSHTWNGQSYDNNLTATAATGTAPTANEAADAICAAIQQMYSFVDDQGEPINEDLTSLTIVTNPTIGNSILQAAKQDKLDTGSGTKDNPVMGWVGANGLSISVIITPRHTDTDAMVLVNSSPNACPLVFLENAAEEMITMKGAGSDYEHDADAWQFGMKVVGAPAYGRFTDAILTTFT